LTKFQCFAILQASKWVFKQSTYWNQFANSWGPIKMIIDFTCWNLSWLHWLVYFGWKNVPIVRLGDRFACFNKEDSLTLHAKSTWLLGLHYGTNGVLACMHVKLGLQIMAIDPSLSSIPMSFIFVDIWTSTWTIHILKSDLKVHMNFNIKMTKWSYLLKSIYVDYVHQV
jgi:hypothetical protein